MQQPFDSTVVRAWATLAVDALGEGRAELDSINVFPVADGDTGTNLLRTVAAAAEGLEEADGASGGPAAPALRALGRAALIGACGNSGTILAQLLRGMAEVYGEAQRGGSPGTPGTGGARRSEDAPGGRLLAAALRRAAESAYEAVARPVEGTMLTVARAAADAAERAVAEHVDTDGVDARTDGVDADSVDPGPAVVARAAHDAARVALSATTGQLDALRRAGVVDAGGSGLVAVLGALADALSDPAAGSRPRSALVPSDAHDVQAPATAGAPDRDPAYEVMYLLEADDATVAALRERLDGLGDSLVVGGGDGLWSVHVHVDDAGAAVEAGVEAGRPHRIRITHLAAASAAGAVGGCAPGDPTEHRSGSADEAAGKDGGAGGTRSGGADSAGAGLPGGPHGRAVVAVVHGDGLAGLCEEAGALVVRAGQALDSEGLPAAVHATGAAEVVLLPNDAELHAAASRAAREARESPVGIRVAVVPTRAAVQGIAALAVHDPERRFDEDVVAMTSAAGATRYGEVAVAECRSWTMAGVCEAGDVLGLVEGDVAVIGSDIAATAEEVLERMLAAGGELVTLVVGEQAPGGLAARLEERVRGGHLGVDTVVYEGGQQCAPLLIGVE
ncbi:DAK2 domain-containing protein [Streptomyces ovatisporus]|uniref:DAK2 domain-containing protein n=1 Tax=Streptomyces ovatisporus TaxID=1128682 RepID=A0ABV9A4W6_9ACTN